MTTLVLTLRAPPAGVQRALALGLAVATAGCAPIDVTTRTERGPLLRTYSRPQVVAGGAQVEVRADWPTLKLTLVGFDTCRAETVEEYAEERITERTSRAAGPALATGIANVLAAGVLYGVSFAVSSVPNVSYINEAGHYGPSTQQYVQSSALITLLIGLPALAVGAIGYLRSGVDVETAKVEQVVSQKDARCNDRPAAGPVTLVGPKGAVAVKAAVDGAVDFQAAELTGAPEGIALGEVELAVDEEGQQRLWGFGACVQLERDAPKKLEMMGEGELLARAERLRQCRVVRGEAMAEPIRAVDVELSRRRETGSPGAFAPGSNVASFEEAVSAYAPKLKFANGSTDLGRLDTPEALDGQAVLLEGIVAEGMTSNIGVIQVGERQLYLFIPPRRAWGGDFGNGTRIEAVAVMAGTQTVGERTLPLARAVWMRAAF
ncbi:MAG: hypothetical protein IT380_13635 [Myxococcales bacterium]|nr:hypothetical protein [Myxococcales bacterium]